MAVYLLHGESLVANWCLPSVVCCGRDHSISCCECCNVRPNDYHVDTKRVGLSTRYVSRVACSVAGWREPALYCQQFVISLFTFNNGRHVSVTIESRVHNRLSVVIGAGSLVVHVATALAGQAQQ